MQMRSPTRLYASAQAGGRSIVVTAKAIPYNDRMDTLYFAYGSNMCLQRLKARVPGVRALGSALLRGHELRWHKKGDDGSAKCSILQVGGDAVVHGALFAIPRREKSALDRVEGSGYNDITVSVESTLGDVTAKTYMAHGSAIDDARQPYSWYKALVVSGAESQGLPPEYVDALRLVDAVADPDAERVRKHRDFLPCGGSG